MSVQKHDYSIALDKLCDKLIEDNERLKDEVKALNYKVLYLSEVAIEEQNEVEAEMENLKIEHFKQLQDLFDDKQQLQQRIDKLQKALDQAYTLASRDYKGGCLDAIEKLFDEMEDDKNER